MRESIINQLVCPNTLGRLRTQVTEARGEEVLEGRLISAEGVEFPIHRGIPSLISSDLLETQTVRSFEQKWAKQARYREQTGRFYTQWYLERYGFFELPQLRECLSGMANILDAGTGTGRDAANFVEHSSATVWGVDAARPAIEAARAEMSDPRLGFVQADINRLPFPDQFFDFINCDQVIHHTADPRAALEHLKRKLKPGGQICCYVYRKKAAIREFTDDYVRQRIRALPIDEALAVCEGITRLGRTLADLKVEIDIEEDIPVLGIYKGKTDLQRFIHWNVMKCFWNDEFDFLTNNIINFDWYHPEHCFRFEPEEFRAWFAEGWEILAWDVREAGISCRAWKV